MLVRYWLRMEENIMKVLMVVDQEQRRTFPLVDRWARTITGIGVQVVMESDFSDFCFDEIACVHLFDLDNMKSVSSWLDLATARSIPCVITPNYWSTSTPSRPRTA